MKINRYISSVIACFGLFSSVSASANLIFPFARDNVWEICQGYNTSGITHKGTLINSFDFAYGTGNLGNTGCANKPSVSENKEVLAPYSGTIAWNGSTAPDITCLTLDTPISNGYDANVNSVKLGHLKSDSKRLGTGTRVSQGETIGITCGASGCTSVGPYAHIHMGVYTSTDCSGTTVPMGIVFGGDFDFSSNETAYQWHGTQIPAVEAATLLNTSHETSWGYFRDPTKAYWYISAASGTTYALGLNNKGHSAWVSMANGSSVANIDFSNKKVAISSTIAQNTPSDKYETASLVDGSTDYVYGNAKWWANMINGSTVPMDWYFFQVASTGVWYIIWIDGTNSTIFRLGLTSDYSNYDWKKPKDQNGIEIDTSTWKKQFLQENGVWKVKFSQ